MDIQESLREALQEFQNDAPLAAMERTLEALEWAPENADALNLITVIAYSLGRYDEAVSFCHRYLIIHPNDAEAYYNLGNALQSRGDHKGAIDAYRKSLALNPRNVDAYSNMGSALQGLGCNEDAIFYYHKALELNPQCESAYNNLGNVLKQQGNLKGAHACLEKAMALNPDNYQIRINLGNILQDMKQFDNAIDCYKIALSVKQDDPNILYNLGTANKGKGDFKQAIIFFEKALSNNPLMIDALYNIGNTWRELGLYDKAISSYEKAIELGPSYFEAYNNLGVAYKEKGEIEKAVICYDKALAINATIAETHWNKALAQLLGGDFENGWKGYEWRWEKQDYANYRRNFFQPLWDGSDIRGKKILLHSEQGYGDAIQFARYIPMVIARGGRIILECQQDLVDLFNCFDGITQLIFRGDVVPDFDLHCPLMSLPLVFKTAIDTIPQNNPYLMAPPDRIKKWQTIIDRCDDGIRVGLAWAGNPEHKNDRNRSCALETFSPLAGMPGVSFYSLQKKGEGGGREGKDQSRMGLVDFADEIQDFADTAAIIMQLDLVISVDTVIAHLAGALGRSVWTMLPFAPDWRWLLDREDSPWYPTMKIFRQPSPGDWKTVVHRIQECLLRLLDLKHDQLIS